ncbi:MAG: hypothetical protein KC582_01310 [Candidatus Magasanikbacteria bacterium]|nr:hypothetical protein [Candidatus Magasanikbacteria bacterium]MCA9390874.1 hypothetical protein [Candidatus Magasanikbacteria bacterium]USN52181.1 MAG: hypothetical protein H6759_04070 [Candidatus Nomurabacteria bacterium]HPF95004.1 hypothetical protein [bacterium]
MSQQALFYLDLTALANILLFAFAVGYTGLFVRLNWLLKPWRMKGFAWLMSYVLLNGYLPLMLIVLLYFLPLIKSSIPVINYSIYGLIFLLLQVLMPLPFVVFDKDRKESTEFKKIEKSLLFIGNSFAAAIVLMFVYGTIEAVLTGDMRAAFYGFNFTLAFGGLFFRSIIRNWRDQYLHK